MDSLTQIILGAACGEAILGKKIGNKALLFGAIGGTIPDLDVFIGNLFYNNEIDAKVEFQLQDILKPTYSGEFFDIIVSNPPYVLESEKKLMHPNVLEYEPHIALFVKDSDPLLFYKSIMNFCKKNLKQ